MIHEKPKYWDQWPEHVRKEWMKVLTEEVYYPDVKPKILSELNRINHLRWPYAMMPKPIIFVGNKTKIKYPVREDIYQDIAPYLSIPFSSIDYAFTVTPHERKANMHILQLFEIVHIPGREDKLLSSGLVRVPITSDELLQLTKLSENHFDVQRKELTYGDITLNKYVPEYVSMQNKCTFTEVTDEWGWGWIKGSKGSKGTVDEVFKFIKYYSQTIGSV